MNAHADARDTDQTPAEAARELIHELETEAHRRVAKRYRIEQRWIDDLRQYHGRYTESQVKKIKEIKGSTVFINLTRPKTNAMIARLTDLLFPTDDQNWAIDPTPVPELSVESEKVANKLEEARARLAQIENEGNAAAEGGQAEAMVAAEGKAQAAEAEITEAEARHEELSAVLEEAADRSRLMESEIKDQLLQSRYAEAARDVIEDGCKIGIGIMKGPVTGASTTARWRKQPGKDGSADIFELEFRADDSPSYYRVDPWGFFPDPDAKTPAESDSFYERHLMTARQMRRLAKRPDIDKDAVRRILRQKPTASLPGYLVQLYDVTAQTDHQLEDRFTVWEFSGTLDAEQLAILTVFMGREDIQDVYFEDGELDPLLEIEVRIWFCQNEVLSFEVHPLETGEPLYSVFNLEKDESSVWGFGMPYVMREEQSIYNSAWRMMMDNAGISTGPQIAIRRDGVTPMDGEYTLTPRKLWWLERDFPQGMNPFMNVNIDGHQAELANIIGLARQQVDEVSSMPQIAEGQQTTGVTKTAQGMAMLMNAANVIFKRIVKNFDDDMTVPNIRRLYHFNMQFSPKDHIKGDYDVNARGSSVLLVREMHAQNLMLLATTLGPDPEFGTWIKKRDILRELVRAMSLSADTTLYTEAEHSYRERNSTNPAVQAEEIKAENLQKERELKEMEISGQIAVAEMQAGAHLEEAQLRHETAMMTLAETHNMKLDELWAKLEAGREDRAASERRLAAEIAMKQTTGDSSGGAV